MGISVRVARSSGDDGPIFRMVCPVCPPVGRATWEPPLSEKDLAEIWNHTADHWEDRPEDVKPEPWGGWSHTDL